VQDKAHDTCRLEKGTYGTENTGYQAPKPLLGK